MGAREARESSRRAGQCSRTVGSTLTCPLPQARRHQQTLQQPAESAENRRSGEVYHQTCVLVCVP
jgi:hypothetical protein